MNKVKQWLDEDNDGKNITVILKDGFVFDTLDDDDDDEGPTNTKLFGTSKEAQVGIDGVVEGLVVYKSKAVGPTSFVDEGDDTGEIYPATLLEVVEAREAKEKATNRAVKQAAKDLAHLIPEPPKAKRKARSKRKKG